MSKWDINTFGIWKESKLKLGTYWYVPAVWVY